MSPRGHEDWGVSSSALNAAPDLPGAEIAARLGALSLYDQTGQLLFASGFERGLVEWVSNLGGAGASVALLASGTFLGAYCARLTGGSDGTQLAEVVKDLPRPFLTRWGLEARARFGQSGGIWRLLFRRYDGTNEHRHEIRLDLLTGNLTLLQADGTYATIAAALSFARGGGIYHPAKLVVDLDNDAYVRLGVGTQSLDLSAYSGRLTADAQLDYIAVNISCISRAGFNDVIDIDSVIVTQNEP